MEHLCPQNSIAKRAALPYLPQAYVKDYLPWLSPRPLCLNNDLCPIIADHCLLSCAGTAILATCIRPLLVIPIVQQPQGICEPTMELPTKILSRIIAPLESTSHNILHLNPIHTPLCSLKELEPNSSSLVHEELISCPFPMTRSLTYRTHSNIHPDTTKNTLPLPRNSCSILTLSTHYPVGNLNAMNCSMEAKSLHTTTVVNQQKRSSDSPPSQNTRHIGPIETMNHHHYLPSPTPPRPPSRRANTSNALPPPQTSDFALVILTSHITTHSSTHTAYTAPSQQRHLP